MSLNMGQTIVFFLANIERQVEKLAEKVKSYRVYFQTLKDDFSLSDFNSVSETSCIT